MTSTAARYAVARVRDWVSAWRCSSHSRGSWSACRRCSAWWRVPVQPLIAVASRSRAMACSRRESQSRPIIPTPASGCRVISHPVHRWPRSSRIPGWVYQQGGNTVDGIRYVRRNQTSHRDNPSTVSEYADGVQVVPADHHRHRRCLRVAAEGGQVERRRRHSDRWCPGWTVGVVVMCSGGRPLGFPGVQGFSLRSDRIGQADQVLPHLGTEFGVDIRPVGSGFAVAGGDHAHPGRVDVPQRAASTRPGRQELILTRIVGGAAALHGDGGAGETGVQDDGVVETRAWADPVRAQVLFQRRESGRPGWVTVTSSQTCAASRTLRSALGGLGVLGRVAVPVAVLPEQGDRCLRSGEVLGR